LLYTNFYSKRIFLVLFERALKELSVSYLEENDLIDNLLSLFDSSNIYLGTRVVNMLSQFYPLLNQDNKRCFDKKIKALKSDIDKNIVNDYEVKKVTKIFKLSLLKNLNIGKQINLKQI
jgi:hypothetical protein